MVYEILIIGKREKKEEKMKKLTKILTLALSIVMVLAAITACGGNDTETETEKGVESAEQEEAGESHSVFLITMDQMDQHWVTVDKGAQAAADELGINYKWIAPEKKDDAKQIEMINQAVADGAQAICIAANSADAVTSALQEAEDAGVKIIYVDSPANFPAVQTIATDNKAAGKTAGEELLAALQDKGVSSGQIGVVGVNSATQSTIDREAGFASAFEGTDFEILETQFTDGDPTISKDTSTNYITQGVVALFGSNEGTTVGVGNAIMESGGEVLGVGFDKSDTILELVEAGHLLAVMSQNPYDMGYEGVHTAVKALKGEDVSPDYIDSGVSVITPDNVAEFR